MFGLEHKTAFRPVIWIPNFKKFGIQMVCIQIVDQSSIRAMTRIPDMYIC